MGGLLDGLANWAADIIEKLGYVGVFTMIVLENVFPPIPSEAILPLAGFLSGQGRMWLPAVIVAATLGAVVGALLLYAIGAWFGDHRMRALTDNHGKWLGVTGEDLDKANGWFDHHGGLAVLICRLVPIIRSLVSIPAGLRRMNLTAFILYTAIGSGIWNSVLVIAGWWLGDNWKDVGHLVPLEAQDRTIGLIGLTLQSLALASLTIPRSRRVNSANTAASEATCLGRSAGVRGIRCEEMLRRTLHGKGMDLCPGTALKG